MSSVAERLKEAREKAGYSTLQASDLSGVPHRVLCRCEEGIVALGPLDIRRLCVIYGCSMEWASGSEAD